MNRFRERFGDLVAVLHSGMDDGERFDEWSRIQLGQAKIAIGARSAIFAPLQNLGLVVIDEEHDQFTSKVSHHVIKVVMLLFIERFRKKQRSSWVRQLRLLNHGKTVRQESTIC